MSNEKYQFSIDCMTCNNPQEALIPIGMTPDVFISKHPDCPQCGNKVMGEEPVKEKKKKGFWPW